LAQMKSRARRVAGVVCTAAIVVLVAGPGGTSSARGLPSATATPRIERFGVFERTFQWSSAGYSNPWEQVTLTMTLTAPNGRRIHIGGFYYGPNTWKARFAPDQVGNWRWAATIGDQAHSTSSHGTFSVAPGGNHGFVRQSAYNRFRWTFADGSPYYPIGIGDCVGGDVDRTPFDGWGLDGRRVGINTYLTAYQRAGVNLFRWSVDNCAFELFQTIAPGGNVYLVREGTWGDALVRDLRAHGFRIYMTIFSHPPFATGAEPADIQAVERYVKYVVDRYGAYVDFWELMNESTASIEWYTQVAQYLRSVDPYHHPISTSSERPDLPVIDINSPHWYETENQFNSDLRTWQQLNAWKQSGKPVIVGEQGNSGHNWDPQSALRMRLRAWTAFFTEGTLIFWNTSSTKNYTAGAGNIYLGPEERGYLRILQNFTRGFDKRAKITPVVVSPATTVRGYALAGPVQSAAYLVNYRDHVSPTVGAHLTVDVSRSGTATWISPATGKVLARQTLRRRRVQTLQVPPFVTDVALEIR
jgi:hypothetical protein